MIRQLIDAVRNPIQIEGCPGEGPYLTRWHLVRLPNFGVMVHRFNRSDRDRELHDHPWPFVSIILWGGYTEVTPSERHKREIMRQGGENWDRSEQVADGFIDETLTPMSHRRRSYRPGAVLYRPARWAHRIEIDRPAWSLVLTFRKERTWGFFTREGWRRWKNFIAERDCA